ncbi:class I SAM-dependent methyltransferase [Actinomyces weissii]|uniref:Class I SAM-dependent methyltransferase n=1 Tax=Actinomyces weissii TaxID=675090 RepID=A0A7T7MB04_9ACTO|nr:class I SAM-dependent methyltransferase [Actinomyces weissii]QQM68169.1 class I SAM-dependent methyltransferase [Actinomyces weissii]
MTIALSSTRGFDLPFVAPASRGLSLPVLSLSQGRLQQWALEAAAVEPTDRLLNLGFGGAGAVRRILRLTSAQVTAFDSSPAARELTRTLNRAALRSGRLRLAEGTVEMLPFRSRSFDVVTAFEVVQGWPSLATGLREARRVLGKGGRLVIANERTLATGTALAETGQGPLLPDTDALIALCQRIGFRRVSAERHERKGWLRLVAVG